MLHASFFLSDQKILSNPARPESPRVSVVLPTYARGDSGLLRRAIESVLSQSYGDFELLVMDDGSIDSTQDIVAEFVSADPRVVHVRHDLNSGLPALRVNEGLLLARGEFCAYQFDDDQWTENSLQRRIHALENNPDHGVAYGLAHARMEGNEGNLGGAFSFDELVAGNYIANNTVLHRKTVFDKHGGYDMHLVMRRLCDWDLWLRWARHVRFLFIPEVVSVVDANMEGSLGRTVDYDLLTSRFHMAMQRDAKLTPETLGSYVVDDIEHFRPLGYANMDRIWRTHVAPYQARHRELWSIPKRFRSRKLHVLVTKAHYDTNVDITIGNVCPYLEGDYVFSFVPTAQLSRAAVESADIIIFHRTIDAGALELAKHARAAGKSTIYLMDDDLLSMHELDPSFQYLAPGSEGYGLISAQLQQVDVAVVYSELMQKSADAFAKRSVLLSTNIEKKWLQGAEHKNDRIRLAFAGSVARKEELDLLWPAFVSISEEFGDRIEFHFWGIKPDGVDTLRCPVYCEPFSYSYTEYLSRLVRAQFDVMVAPLFAEKQAKRAKCPIKFLEATAAGAIGIYSDVEPYEAVEHGITGIKVKNTPQAWAEALHNVLSMTASKRAEMVKAARAVVEVQFASDVQAEKMAAALQVARLYSTLGASSPKLAIAYVFHSPYQGGAENHLLRHACIAAAYGFPPVLVFPMGNENSDNEIIRRGRERGFPIEFLPLRVETEPTVRVMDESSVGSIRSWLSERKVGFVHSVTVMQELGRACRLAGVPHVSSLYAVEAEGADPVLPGYCDVVHSDSLLYANRWSQLLGVQSTCIRSHVPLEYFAQGAKRSRRADSHPLRRIGIFGTVQPRKGQLQAIEAVGRLRAGRGIEMELHIYGYTQFFPDYIEACEKEIERWGLADKVFFHGFVDDTAAVLSGIDITLCASDWESLPQVILESMAAEVLVVAPDVGGISEIVSRHTGVLVKNNAVEHLIKGLEAAYDLPPDERVRRTHLARSAVAAECSAGAVASALFQMYADAVTLNRGAAITEAGGGLVATPPQILSEGIYALKVAAARAEAAAFARAIRA